MHDRDIDKELAQLIQTVRSQPVFLEWEQPDWTAPVPQSTSTALVPVTAAERHFRADLEEQFAALKSVRKTFPQSFPSALAQFGLRLEALTAELDKALTSGRG